MSRTVTFPAPPPGFSGTAQLALMPREKKSFNAVLDAHTLLARSIRPVSEARYSEEGGEVVLRMEHPIADGRMREELRLARGAEELISRPYRASCRTQRAWSREGKAILTVRGWTQSERFDSAWAILAATYEMQVTTFDYVIDIRRVPRRVTSG